MERIVRGYWDCPYCDSAGIDGLIDNCPTCGVQKPKTIKYYMKPGVVEYVSDSELEVAGITKEECDGIHKDWICNYCDQLNDYSEDRCTACGATKDCATHEYGGAPLEDSSEEDTSFSHLPSKGEEAELLALVARLAAEEEKTKMQRRNTVRNIKFAGIAIAVIAFLSLMVFLLYPLKREVSVTQVSWVRNVTVEEERTVKESDWTVPSGGRTYDQKEEFRKYVQVLDHYETVEETKSRQVVSHYETVTETKTRQVLSHYETEYSYRDNGNGTFSEISHQRPVYKTETYTESHQEPVYKTEYYTETHQEPVYRQEAVYDTKYYYEIERWFDLADYETSGSEHNAYWSNDYELQKNQRDTKRTERYIVHYSDGSTKKMDYENWVDVKIGDKTIITHNRLGIIYARQNAQ